MNRTHACPVIIHTIHRCVVVWLNHKLICINRLKRDTETKKNKIMAGQAKMLAARAKMLTVGEKMLATRAKMLAMRAKC